MREIGNWQREGNNLSAMVALKAGLGRTRDAVWFCEQALEIDREIGDRKGESADLILLGRLYLSEG